MSVRHLRRYARHQCFRAMAVAERATAREYRLRYSPTFIVGPARSGTTLVRQVVAWGLSTCHFTNLLAEAQLQVGYPLPVITAKIIRWLHGSPPLDRHYRADPFHNTYGHIRGRTAPAEGEMLWAHWFGSRYSPVSPEELDPTCARAMYQAVAATENVFELPFVNKTTALSVRIEALAQTFPSASFIHVRRNRVDTAQSIIRARRAEYPEWLGAKPRECEGLESEPLHHQVCKQVHYVERAIVKARRTIGDDRFLSISYRDVCENARREVSRIGEFMIRHGAPARPARAIPETFTFSHGRKIPESEYKDLRHCMELLAKQEGEEWARLTA